MDMKRIIGGTTYNTATAVCLGHVSYGNQGGFNHFEEWLYQTKKGAFFLAGSGGAMSRYAESCSDGSTSGGSRITPLTDEDTREWAEEYLDVDDYAMIFGVACEAGVVGGGSDFNLRLPPVLRERVKAAAGDVDVSMNAWILRVLEKSL